MFRKFRKIVFRSLFSVAIQSFPFSWLVGFSHDSYIVCVTAVPSAGLGLFGCPSSVRSGNSGHIL